MTNRIFKNWKSSLIGIILLISAGAFCWFGKITFTEFAAFVPFCLTLIYVQDSIFKINPKP